MSELIDRLKAAMDWRMTFVSKQLLQDCVDALESFQWIPVSERLPEIINEPDGGVNSVLIYAKDGYECGSDFQTANAAWVNGPYAHCSHWMPLPAPPTTQSDGG